MGEKKAERYAAAVGATIVPAAEVVRPRRTLFKIAADFLAFDELLEEIGGDLSDKRVDEAATAIAAELATDLAGKLDGWACYLAQLEMEEKACKAQASEFSAKARARTNRIGYMKAFVKSILDRLKLKEVKTLEGRTVAVTGNGGVFPIILADGLTADDVPERFRKVTAYINVEAIRDALNAGEKLSFAHFGDRGTSLRIR